VLEERAGEWFDLDVASPYMLLVASVIGAVGNDHVGGSFEQRATDVSSPIPACTHVDGSARVQTVGRAVNPRFRALLESFDRWTGCPVLLNTSFNLAGEPIVASPDDALATAGAAGLDLLVIGDVLIDGSALP
jgi:carbamoyltransferase